MPPTAKPVEPSADIAVNPLLDQLANELAADPRVRAAEAPVLVGIHTGGAWVADHIAPRLEALGVAPCVRGSLGISFYRDDFSRIGVNPRVQPSQLPESLDGRTVILIDDILYTGRTIRAAMNEIFDYGRPDAIVLGILVDRGGRELPVAADAVGTTLTLDDNEHVKLAGPEPLSLSVHHR